MNQQDANSEHGWREAANRARSSWETAADFRPESAAVRPGGDNPVPAKGSRNAPRLALSPAEAAAVLGVSRDFFDKHIASELRMVRRGRRKLVPVRELERWLEHAASLLLGEH
jgi:excisionase family DNA binding protein